MLRRAFLILLLLVCQANAATVYLRSSDGNDADDGSTWALAKATLASALTAAGAGGTVYVSDNHAETQASAMTLTSPGTAASPVRVLCVDDSAEPPTALATTATISTTGANHISCGGYCWLYGVKLSAGSGASTANVQFTAGGQNWWAFDSCRLTVGNTSASSAVFVDSATLVEMRNTVVEFGASGQSLFLRHPIIWTGSGSSVAGTVPTALFSFSSLPRPGLTTVRGVDLSAVTTNLCALSGAANYSLLFEDCKLAGGVTVGTGSITGQAGGFVRLVNCDSADTNYRYHKQTYQGTITQESTIVRTGGATDGTTPISRKMVTTANSKYFSPLESDPILFWNETTGSNVTVTVPVITDNVTLTDAEAWVEVEYLGTSGFPIASTASDRSADILATAVAQTTDSTSTWTTTGLTTPVKQTLSVTFTPAEKGLIRARVMLAKASTTMYYDPKINSGIRQYQGTSGTVNEGAGGGSRARAVNPRD